MKERANPKWKPPPPAVLTLTQENFTEVVFSEELILVEFFAPWYSTFYGLIINSIIIYYLLRDNA